MTLPVSVLIMTQNEEANIKFAIESVLPHFDQVIVADSFSTDNTISLLKQYSEVEVYQHKFESWADQRNWMLSNCRIRNEVVFFLDADEYIDLRLVNELQDTLEKGIKFAAIYLDREYIFLGGTLKHSHGHPLTFRIFKKQGLTFVGEGAREYAKVYGPAIKFNSPYIHYDRNPLAVWFSKHNNNSDREAELYIARQSSKVALPSKQFSRAQMAKLWIRANLWDKLPLLLRPFLYFPARYIYTRGFLEGTPAFVYIYLNAFLYQALIDAKILNLQAAAEAGKSQEIPSDMTVDKLPVTVLIMTQNEEENIRYAVESVLPYFSQVIVTDSFSTDKTIEILKEYPGVEVLQHAFESWADQRNWMLENCTIRNEKVFFLDADEYITPGFVEELRQLLNSPTEFKSVIMTPHFMFMGRYLHYAYGHPKIKRLFSREVRFLNLGAREYAMTDGLCLEMATPFFHCDHKPLRAWVAKHNNNSEREALTFLDRKGRDAKVKNANLSSNLKTTLWIRRNIWNNMPFLFRAPSYFIYRYVFKRGFMDGKPGFVYCLLHAFLYQTMIDVKILEKTRNTLNA